MVNMMVLLNLMPFGHSDYPEEFGDSGEYVASGQPGYFGLSGHQIHQILVVQFNHLIQVSLMNLVRFVFFG